LPRFGGAFYSYWAAVARWPRARITLRQGARVVATATEDRLNISPTNSN